MRRGMRRFRTDMAWIVNGDIVGAGDRQCMSIRCASVVWVDEALASTNGAESA